VDNEYLKLVQKSRENQQQLTLEQYKKIRKMYKDIASELKVKASKANKGSLTERWLKDYRESILSYISELNKNLKKEIESDMEKSVQNAVGVQLALFDTLNIRYGLGMDETFKNMFSSVPEDVLNNLITGEFYKDGKGLDKRIWNNQIRTNRDIDYIIQKGIAEKKSAYELAQDLQVYVNPDAKKSWEWKKVYPGSNKKIDYNAQRLARTSISHAYTLSMLKSCEKNPFVEEIQWHSVFSEGRTCPLCKERDGKIYTIKECPVDHPNGMCYQTPLVEESLEDIGTRLNKWVNGSSDPMLDDWYKKYGDYFSGEHNLSKDISKKGSNEVENNGIISDKRWLKASFPDEKKFKKHIEKHLAEYGNLTEEEYLSTARELLAEPLSEDVKGFISDENFIFKYKRSTNDFSIGRPNNKISTLFKPKDGYQYWLDQIEKYKKEE
jgi:SPP1 gp7 family putative phage head morphogenesis protein